MNYMKLLVAQLQNQNPLDPMDNNAMASQLAQFSELQQLESMSSSFSDVLATTKMSYADSLIGKNISFAVQSASGDLETMTGLVKQVLNDPTNGTTLVASATDGSTYTVSLDGIISVSN